MEDGIAERSISRGKVGAVLLVLIMVARIAVIHPLTLSVGIGLVAYAVMAVGLWFQWRHAPTILMIWFSLAVAGGFPGAFLAQNETFALVVMIVISCSILFGWFILLYRRPTPFGAAASVFLVLLGNGLALLYIPRAFVHR